MADLDEQKLKVIVEAARVQFDAAHTDREQALRAARLMIQLSSRAIPAAHRGEMDEARNLAKQAGEEILPDAKWTRARREFFDSGLLHDAEKEYVEATFTIDVLSNESLPSADDLGVGPAPI